MTGESVTERRATGFRLYPYVLAAAFALGTWLTNLSEEPTALDVGLTFALALGFAAVADGVLRLRLRDADRRSLWLVLLVVGFFGYGHGFELARAGAGLQHRHFVPIWMAALGATAFAIVLIGRRRLVGPVSRWVRNTSWLLVAVQPIWAGPGLWSCLLGSDGLTSRTEPTLSLAGAVPAEPSVARPDIYYIILDGYARADVLRDLFRFDNGEFVQALRRRGFYVASEARSNYTQTRFSLTSSFSMDYLPEPNSGESADAYHERIRPLRKHGRAVERLRELGYRYRYVGSMYFPVDAAADEELTPAGAGRTYLRAFLETTALGPVEKAVGWGRGLQDPVAITEHQLRSIARPKGEPGPLYTFAHIACPHEPYLYDRHGPLRAPVPASEATPHDYVEQLRYLNGRVLELIDGIERLSGPDAVILLQADHGSDFLGIPPDPDERQVFERTSILSAYRCPPHVRDRLCPSITPVNSFRVLFAGLFGDDLPLLDDRSFYSSYDTPLDFVETPSAASKH